MCTDHIKKTSCIEMLTCEMFGPFCYCHIDNLLRYTTSQKFLNSKIFLCFLNKSLLLTKPEFTGDEFVAHLKSHQRCSAVFLQTSQVLPH